VRPAFRYFVDTISIFDPTHSPRTIVGSASLAPLAGETTPQFLGCVCAAVASEAGVRQVRRPPAAQLSFSTLPDDSFFVASPDARGRVVSIEYRRIALAHVAIARDLLGRTPHGLIAAAQAISRFVRARSGIVTAGDSASWRCTHGLTDLVLGRAAPVGAFIVFPPRDTIQQRSILPVDQD
jgi:hypothetical protein